MKLHSTKNTLLAFLALTTLTGCDDPQREAKLKWREEEVNAKELDVARREALVSKEKQIVESTRLNLLAKQKSVELLQKQAAEELEKTKRSRREFEIKNLRGPVPQISADRVIIIDPASDEVLFDKNADKRGAIASTTKLLTALLVVETGSLDQIITVEQSDTHCAPVRLGIKAGDQYTRHARASGRKNSAGEPWMKTPPRRTWITELSHQSQVRRPKERRAAHDGSCRPTYRTCRP